MLRKARKTLSHSHYIIEDLFRSRFLIRDRQRKGFPLSRDSVLEHAMTIERRVHLRTHFKSTSRGFLTCNVILGWLFSTTFPSLSLAMPSVSPGFCAASTLQLAKISLMTLTNSTCAIFEPGQERGPLEKGINVPLGGLIKVSPADPGEGAAIQRVGRKTRGSGPYRVGETCIHARAR